MQKLVPMAALSLIFWADMARAECQFKTPDAILCSDPEMAIIMYQQYGFDSNLINQTYTLKILAQGECIKSSLTNGYADYGSYKKQWKPLKVQEVAQGKIATVSGWISVSELLVTMDHNPIYPDQIEGKQLLEYAATAYLADKCERVSKASH